jgi:hypothetical protein
LCCHSLILPEVSPVISNECIGASTAHFNGLKACRGVTSSVW